MRHYKRVDGELVEMTDEEVTKAKNAGRRFSGIPHVPHAEDFKAGNNINNIRESDLVMYTDEQEAQRDQDALDESRINMKKALEVEAVNRINQILPSVADLAGLKSLEDVLANLPKVENAPIDKAIAIRTVYEKESKKVESMKQEKIDAYDVKTIPGWPT